MMTVFGFSGSGRSDARTTGSSVRITTSSRCIATSIIPSPTGTFSIVEMMSAMRRPFSFPRDGIPARMIWLRSGLRSMISCAIRRSARRIAAASITRMDLSEEVFVFFSFMSSFATSQDRLKGGKMKSGGSLYRAAAFFQAFLSPVGTVPNNPIEQRLLEANIGSGFLALDPLVFQNFFALRQEFFVKNGVLNELRLIF